MIATFMVNAVLIVHAAFILFVVAGGLLALRWPRIVWLHLPAVAWGAAVEWMGWICPLTPLENRFRSLAGQSTYEDGFLAYYLFSAIYPVGLTPDIQRLLGAGVVILNVAVYTIVLVRRRRN